VRDFSAFRSTAAPDRVIASTASASF
jgi:hypothetical protein